MVYPLDIIHYATLNIPAVEANVVAAEFVGPAAAAGCAVSVGVVAHPM